MSKLTFEVSRYQCTVELTTEQFLKLDKMDYLDYVMPELEKLGAYDIEYNGHFGPNVFFTCDNLEEAKKITERLELMLK